jgi:hypothetical protein
MTLAFVRQGQVTEPLPAARRFLKLILPSGGWIVGWAYKDGKRLQKAFTRIEDLLSWLAQHEAMGFDVYHGCASFTQSKVWNPNKRHWKTHEVVGGWETRTHANVHSVASLWADIDTRLSHANAKYADADEATHALWSFCAQLKIPFPLLVFSGGGIHAYWPLEEELTREAWEALARALEAAFKHHGVDCRYFAL